MIYDILAELENHDVEAATLLASIKKSLEELGV